MNQFTREKPLVSIVIPSWFTHQGQHGKYGEHETFWFGSECLKRLLETSTGIKDIGNRPIFELIIIDNGSTLTQEDIDESIGRASFASMGHLKSSELVLTNESKNVEKSKFSIEDYWSQADILIRNKNNLGFGPAVNQGIAVARGEYICCLNNDILVWDGWLNALLNVFSIPNPPKPVGVVMPALVQKLRDAREAIKLEKIECTKNAGVYSPGAEFGSLWIARTDLLRKIAQNRDGYQVLDEGFVNGKEDRLLWLEIRKLGLETYRTHDTRVFHQGQMSCGKTKDRHLYRESNTKLLKKEKERLGFL